MNATGSREPSEPYRDHKLCTARQAELLGISRGRLCHEPRPVSEDDLRLMRRIDELNMEFPFAGSRMMKGLLRQEGFTSGGLHVSTLMKHMGIEALYRKPITSKPAPDHKVYPHLLHKLAATRANQVWAMDISSFPWLAGSVQPQGAGLAALGRIGNGAVPEDPERGDGQVR